MDFPYPLDDCECGHYRIDHNARAGSGDVACKACGCHNFTVKPSKNERGGVKPPVK